jgi:hypothetical protein
VSPGAPFQRGARPTGYTGGRRNPAANPQGGHSPYARTTLTVPGAIPAGLPGTSGPRPKGPGAGKGHRAKGPREQRVRHDDDNRGNRAPREVTPALADEDGNR